MTGFFTLLIFTLCLSGGFWSPAVVEAITQSEISQNTDLQCERNGFIVQMNSSLVFDGVGSDESIILYIGDKGECNYTGNAVSGNDNDKIYKLDADTFVFNFTYPDCLSERQYVIDYLKYDALIGRDSFYIEGTSPVITRIAHLQVNLDCVYYLNGTTVSTSFQVLDEPIVDNLTADGIISLRAELYKYSDFGVKYPNFPIYVNQGKLLYVQVSELTAALVQEDAQYELIVENCTVSDLSDLSDPSVQKEEILIDTCPTNASLYNFIDNPPSTEIARFSMPAVGFFTQVDATWLTCTVIICDLDETTTTECQRERNCPPTVEPTTPEPDSSRQKRAYHEDFGQIYEYKTREQFLLGRIILLDSGGETEETVLSTIDSEAQVSVAVSGAGSAGVATVITAGAPSPGADDEATVLDDACSEG